MALLSILGGIGSALGIIGSGISLFSGSKKGSAVSSAGSAINNAASSLSGVSAQQAGVQGSAEQAALSRDVFEYQKQLQQQIFQREDDAVQRRVRDLEAAGLSPTLAAGSSAGAGQAIKVDTPQSAALLKSQALAQGIQNMLSISQAKANIALTEAQAKKTSAEAGVIDYDLDWYKGAFLPSGTHSGLAFLSNTIANVFGLDNSQAASFLRSALIKIAEKLGIDAISLLNDVKGAPPEIFKEVIVELPELAKSPVNQGNFSFAFVDQERSISNTLEKKLEDSESFMTWLSKKFRRDSNYNSHKLKLDYYMFLRKKRDGSPFPGDGFGGGFVQSW